MTELSLIILLFFLRGRNGLITHMAADGGIQERAGKKSQETVALWRGLACGLSFGARVHPASVEGGGSWGLCICTVVPV
jgi:hypothetical protein